MGTVPWSGGADVLDDRDSPAVYVSWNDAQAFIAELNAQTDRNYRLPSEAEWEYACRAGTTTRFSHGDDPSLSELLNHGWVHENARAVGERYAHVVGQKEPNPWGLYDMHGNVGEWCQDWWHLFYEGAPVNGSAWNVPESLSSYERVVRNSGWSGSGDGARSAYRYKQTQDHTRDSIGFRLVR